MVTSSQGLHRHWIGMVMVSLSLLCSQGGRRRLQPLQLSHTAVQAPGPAQHAVNSSLLLVAQNSGMKCSAGAWGVRSPQVSQQPWRSCLCHSRLLIAFGREFHLFGTTLATWTLHKLCTLVQPMLSICELSYLTLRMKTSKKGLGGVDFN